jgi:hypothetical protein
MSAGAGRGSAARAAVAAAACALLCAAAPRAGAAPAQAGTRNARDARAAGAPGSEAIERFESYLALFPDSPSRAEVLFTLGQLYEEAETAAAMETAAGGEAPNAIPHPDAIRCYAAAVDSHPDFGERAACLYRLGVVLAEAGEADRAASRLRALLAESESDPHAGPARLRLAEIAESRAAWADAAGLYGDALAGGVDAHAEKLHYRRAWALYRSGGVAAAIAALREGIVLEERLGSDPDAGFLRESLALLAMLVSRADDGAGWEAIADDIQDGAGRRRFLAELGVQLGESDRAAAALPVLDRALAEGPEHAEAPLAAHAAIAAADRVDAAGAVERRLRFEESYASGSAWRRGAPLPPEESVRLDALCEAALYDAGALLYDAARSDTADAGAAARADEALRRAVARHPDSERRDEARFLIGELARAASRWGDAIASYDAAGEDALAPERREALLYGRVLARDGARAAAAAADGPESEAARRAAAAAGDAADAYLARFPESPSAATVRRRRAELLALAGDPGAAVDAFRALFDAEPGGSTGARDLAALVAANLARAGRHDEAAAWYDTAKDPQRAAAALYEGAHRRAAADRPEAAGLALLALLARYPRADVAGAATLDAIDLLSRGDATDTLAAWVSSIAPAPQRSHEPTGTPAAGAAPGDSLQRALVAAARRAEPRDAAAAGRLFREAARFGPSEGAADALLRAGEALQAAGHREDAVVALSAALVRFPRDAASLPPALLAADLLADSLHDAAAAVTLLDASAGAARAATPGWRAAWRRRSAHALACAGRAADALAAFDRCLADTAGLSAETASDSLRLERETAIAAIEKADIVRAALPPASPRKLAAADVKRLQAKADEAVALYAFAIRRAFRDLTSRAGHDAALALEAAACAFLESAVAGRDAAHAEAARRAAGRAVAFRAAVAGLPETPPDAWMQRASAGLDLRSRLAARLVAASDSLAPAAPLSGESLGEKEISSRIVALDRLVELLAPARGLALDDSAADLEARIALVRGGLAERMADLLVAAPVPRDLDADGEETYRRAVHEKAGEFEERAAALYREALDHVRSLESNAARELEQRLALLTARSPARSGREASP